MTTVGPSNETPRRATGLHAYNPTTYEHLVIRPKEDVTIISTLGGGWFLGINSSGDVGKFPAAVVQLKEDDHANVGAVEPDDTQPEISTEDGSQHSVASSSDRGISKINADEPNVASLGQDRSRKQSRNPFTCTTGSEDVSELEGSSTKHVPSSSRSHNPFFNLGGSTPSNGITTGPNEARSRDAEQLSVTSPAVVENDADLASIEASKLPDAHVLWEVERRLLAAPDPYLRPASRKSNEDDETAVTQDNHEETTLPTSRRFSFSSMDSHERLMMKAAEHQTQEKPSSPVIRARSELSAQTNLELDKPAHPSAVGEIALSRLPCAICGVAQLSNAFCDACLDVFCDSCWLVLRDHRQASDAGNGPHQKTDGVLAGKVKGVLHKPQGEIVPEDMFREDSETAWFGECTGVARGHIGTVANVSAATGVVREHGELPSFQDYGRYSNLMANTRPKTSVVNPAETNGTSIWRRFPSLVSFVGDTGAGKSSIIKLLIDLDSPVDHDFATPVVGTAGSVTPTSDDVHLYLDPRTVDTDSPLLYADCEGLNGGERVPTAARFRKAVRAFQRVQVEDPEPPLQKRQYTSRRELLWTDESAVNSREFAVENLYPRLLYTFSDVIVFILKAHR